MPIPTVPGHRLRRGMLGGSAVIVTVIVAVACLSYWSGTYRAGQLAALSGADKAERSRESDACREQLEECRQQTVNLSKGAEIDAAVLAQTRTEVAQGRARMARLEQDVTLYRSLVEGSVRTAGVSVHSLDIARVAGDEGRRYRYRLTFIQRAERQIEVQGFASVSVSGTRDGKALSIGLPGPDARQSGNRVPLRFVYFQTLEGDFSLPEGFQPLQVRVRAEIRKGKPPQAERTFDWTVVED
jgi:hypothetical protein